MTEQTAQTPSGNIGAILDGGSNASTSASDPGKAQSQTSNPTYRKWIHHNDGCNPAHSLRICSFWLFNQPLKVPYQVSFNCGCISAPLGMQSSKGKTLLWSFYCSFYSFLTILFPFLFKIKVKVPSGNMFQQTFSCIYIIIVEVVLPSISGCWSHLSQLLQRNHRHYIQSLKVHLWRPHK